MPTQAMHLFTWQKVRKDPFIGLQDRDRGDEKLVACGVCGSLVGRGSLDRRGRVVQRGTVLRGLLDDLRRGVPVPL